MKIDQPDRQRRSIRLPDYDYCQPGAYFITICSYQREALFGNIAVDEMRLNEAGQIVWEVWNSLPARYAGITLGAAVVMPNHFHGIIIITDGAVGAIHELPLPSPQELPLQQYRAQRRRMTLPMAVGYFKMNTAKRINELRGTPGLPVWQRNYYEHIIRGENDLQTVTDYIETNPLCWAQDEYCPPVSSHSTHQE